MAKIKQNKNETKTKKIENITLKGCTVKLKRLSQLYIQQKLQQHQTNKNVTVNISAQIKDGILTIGENKIGSKNMVFDIHLKVHDDGFNIIENQSSSHIQDERPKRTMKNPVNDLKQIQKSNLVVATLQPKIIAKAMEDAWKKCKLSRNGEFQLNDFVMAKLKGHKPWPSKIIEFVNKKKVKVEFLGANKDQKFGFISTGELVHFSQSSDVIRLILQMEFVIKPNFIKGIIMIEVIFGVPPDLSILNK